MDDLVEQILLSRHPLWDWTQKEVEEVTADFKAQQEGFKTKLVVAYTIYNEEQFLEESLENCLIIKDIDGIHLLDGAWKVENQKMGSEPNSMDQTKQIIKNFHINHPEIKVLYEPTKRIWNSEGEKRNHQLKSIEKIWGKQTYAIIKDGDETFEFNTGRRITWLKFELDSMYPALFTVKGYAYNAVTPMNASRFIPLGMGYHYHTEKAMLMHDEKCNILCDYNSGKEFKVDRKCLDYEKIRYINHWNVRNHERLVEKDKYATEVYSFKPYGKCKAFNVEEDK